VGYTHRPARNLCKSAMSDQQNHQYCTEKFIDLANELKDEGMSVQLVSAALMAASGIYATYTAAGNTGALEPSGVDKVVNLYRKNLEFIQDRKKQELTGGES
jgi:hypothetical protein